MKLFTQVQHLIFIINPRAMSTQPSSSPLLPSPNTPSNAQVAESQTQPQTRECSLGKTKPLQRRPHNLHSNIEAYKSIKRNSQEKETSEQAAPPRCPRFEHQTEKAGRFKKKALSKQEILELRAHKEMGGQDLEVSSVGGSEQPRKEIEATQMKEKSRTQYFHIEEFQRQASLTAQSEALQQSQSLYIASLKQKCLSVDQNNSLLQKRISWLRQQVEMHLQRQFSLQQTHQQLQAALDLKEKQLICVNQQLKHKEEELIQKNQQIQFHLAQKEKLIEQLHQRDCQLEHLKGLIVDLHNRFQEENEALNQQIDFLKNERETELEELKHADQRIRDLQNALIGNHPLPQLKQSESSLQVQYSLVIEQLSSQNKYLRVENHVLARSKEEVSRLQKELKRIANERDTFKKKIIEVAKRNARCLQEDSDSSFFLSEPSHSDASFNPH